MATTAGLEEYAEQRAAVTVWLADLSDAEWSSPSALPGWDVRTLVGHLVMLTRGLGEDLPARTTGKAFRLADYVAHYRASASWIADRSALTAGEWTGPELATQLERLDVRAAADLPGKTVLAIRDARLTVGDWIRTRVLDLVVHADDLNRSLPYREPIAMPRKPLGIAVKTLTALLCEQAPGGSVEVRIPPYAAVQVIDGLRHTRGTPPNVVETDALTWLRLATGRADFANAVETGRVRASGTRADLTPYLPVLG